MRVNAKSWWCALLCLVAAVLVLSPGGSARAQTGAGSATLITLDADSSYVNSILQILSEKSSLNIVTAPEVQRRKISIHLRNTPFEEALNLVVRSAGLGYERVGNSILVADPRRLQEETGLASYYIELQYANAEDVKQLLTLMTNKVEAQADGGGVVVTASPAIIEQVKDVVRKLDAPPLQVLLETRVLEVNTTRLEELGIDWSRITKFTTIWTEGNPVVSTTDEIPDNSPYIKGDEYADWYRQTEAIQASVDLLVTDGSARVLANAKVATANNKKAEIFSGQTIRVVTQVPTSSVGGVQTLQIQVEKIEVGVALSITPKISKDGFITTLVEPDVSTILGFTGPFQLPQTSTRRASTLIRVKDGSTFYIGGLLSENETKTVQKVPLLGDIPLLGKLFSHHRVEKSKTDLLIEVTPHILQE